MINKADLARYLPPWLVARVLDVLALIHKASRTPALQKINPWVNPAHNDLRWLPINTDLQLPAGAPLPLELLDRFIEEASHRAIFDFCGCRLAYKCKHYPTELGCLMMGDTAAKIVGGAGHEVGIDEAKRRVRDAIDAGLVPLVGKARLDNFLFGVWDHGDLLSVCFCCECCCITGMYGSMPLEIVEPMFAPLEGISVTIDEEACEGCGKCLDQCLVKALSIESGIARINEYCRACGRCASACPSDAIRISIDDPAWLDKAYEKISAHVKHT